jgi:hypothetical protein
MMIAYSVSGIRLPLFVGVVERQLDNHPPPELPIMMDAWPLLSFFMTYLF